MLVEPFDFQTVIGFHFPPDQYTITHDGSTILARPYTEPLLAEETDEITAAILAKVFGIIRGKAGQEKPDESP